MTRVLGLFLFVVSLSLHGAEHVVGFHSDIRIAPSGTLTVTETIEVQAEGKEIRRGILRDFPTDYRNRLGYRVPVPLEVIKVLRNGQPEPYRLEPLAKGTRVKGTRIHIGDENRTLPNGKQVYQIAYRAERQLGFFAKHDELYWNVNGSSWTFPLERLTAEVTFAQPVPAGDIHVDAYTGAPDARGREYNAFVRHGSVAFRMTRAAKPGEAMTIVVAFPKGVVTPPSLPARARGFVSANRGLTAGLAGLVALLAFLLWRWRLVGRDPRASARIAPCEPPPGMGPAGARYIDRMALDERCFAAALLGLASRGFLTIRHAGGRYRVERTGKEVDWLPGEQEIARRLLPGESEGIDLDEHHDPAIEEARARFDSAIRLQIGARLFSKNRGSLMAGIAITLATLLGMLAFDASALDVGVLLGVMLLALFLFWRWLPPYSVQGRELQRAVQGLREFLAAPAPTPEAFAKFLPYAVALGLEKTWAERNPEEDGTETFADSLPAMERAIAAASTRPASADLNSGSDPDLRS